MNINKPPGPAEPLDPKFHFKFTLRNATEAINWFKDKIQELKNPSPDQRIKNKQEEQELLKP